MFPLSFSSSSSLSSIPPSLDAISELDRGLSDISEDDDLTDVTAASHTPWTLPSNTSCPFSDQQLADLEHLTHKPAASCPITGLHTYSSELLGVEESCHAETRATAGVTNPCRWFSPRGVVKCVSFILCFFFLLGRSRSGISLPSNLMSGLTNKLSLLTAAVSKLTYKSARILKIVTARAPKFITPSMTTILNALLLKWTRLVAFVTSYLPTKWISFVPAVLWHRTGLNLSSMSSLACPPVISSLSSLPALSSLPSNLLSLPPSFSRNLTPSIHRYLRNPSPLFLPCLLVVFLLVVMLTASQSLVLALILATPLGLTLCYLENVVSSQRKTAILPMFVSDRSEEQLDSDFDRQASPLTLQHTPPRMRHQAPTSANWTQEMCDPAA